MKLLPPGSIWTSVFVTAVVAHVRVINLHDFAEVYLNVMLLIPLGYLLPYIFRWYRAKVHVRPVVTAFLLSLFTENVQLVTKVGFYDIDDLITNTLGGLIGQELFVVFAFVVTNPDWRKDLRSLRTWRRRAKARALYPFARRLETSRTTSLATDEDAIHEFYVSKLGFRLIAVFYPIDCLRRRCDLWPVPLLRPPSRTPHSLLVSPRGGVAIGATRPLVLCAAALVGKYRHRESTERDAQCPRASGNEG